MNFVNKKLVTIRLDLAISQEIAEISRKQARNLCEEALVIVDGKIAAPGFLLKGGERVEILKEIKKLELRPELVKENGGALSLFKVLEENNHVLAISKPREMASIRLRTDDQITLADCIAAYCPQCASASEDLREAGLLQRLDFYTSGVVLAAKSKDAHRAFRKAFREKKFLKTYLALVEGVPKEKEFEINLPLFSIGKKMRLAKDGEKEAQSAKTKVGVLEKIDNNQSLLRLTTNSGRRHQIRAHLALSGHPLVGDQLYGANTSLKTLTGFLLHAESIEGLDPLTGKKIKIIDKKNLTNIV